MPRNRVLSFMSNFSNRDKGSSAPPSPVTQQAPFTEKANDPSFRDDSPPRGEYRPSNVRDSSQRRGDAGNRNSSRPMSMVQTYQPPLMDVNSDTPPELLPIFTYLNSHGNKLYQEGYFLKLDDQNSQGKPNTDRTWTEVFAQLVGTILSIWDAAELDAAGAEGEVLPKFINLTDASIKMIESLPTRSNDDQPLQNVLSISTAGKNRYLLHFNSHHSLVQWTAGIRLAMYEYTTLQEAYTGALIAGKGKTLNSINVILARNTFKYEDWVRVRFGAGTPWRQCWCVVTPPDEKEFAKVEKELKKKKSAYDRSRPPVVKGHVKFYDTKKVTKKTKPIATISDAFSAYAIYPQSKPLIDASTLVKVEGVITIHSEPPTTTEGFVFVMPEVHPAVSGFEIMLRWLFPVFDTFALYGRPQRLVADTLDTRSLMFAMPKERRYGYLEILDVATLITTQGSQSWQESEWRRRLKDLTSKRMQAVAANGGRRSRRNTLQGRQERDNVSIRSTPSIQWGQAPVAADVPRTDSAPPVAGTFAPPQFPKSSQHNRSASESHKLQKAENRAPISYDSTYDQPPAPPPHQYAAQQQDGRGHGQQYPEQYGRPAPPERDSSDESGGPPPPVEELRDLQITAPVQPVAKPPSFAHRPGTAPSPNKLRHSPELRRTKSRLSDATLAQMAGAGGIAASAGIAQYQAEEEARHAQQQQRNYPGGHPDQRGVNNAASASDGTNANQIFVNEGLVAGTNRLSFEHSSSSGRPSYDDPYYRPARNSFEARQQNANPRYQVTNAQAAGAAGVAAGAVFQKTSESRHGLPRLSTDSNRSQTSSSDKRQSIQRKPLPGGPAPQQQRIMSPDPSEIGTSRFDQGAFEQIVPRVQLPNQDLSPDSPDLDRKNSAFSKQSSNYEDNYDSIERPRAGVMKTVGGAQDYDHQQYSRPTTDIPAIDFGPTIGYAGNPLRQQGNRPPVEQVRSGNVASAAPVYKQAPRNRSPQSAQQEQYQPEHKRNQASRTLAWQPGMAAPREPSSSQRPISPEEFVRERASVMANAPQYVHQRQKSSTSAYVSGRDSTAGGQQGPRPPYAQHSRNNSSQDMLRPGSGSRPSSSRGPSPTFEGGGNAAGGANLTAKDREQLSRMTGQPLVNLAGGGARGGAPSGGLVAAIDDRQREKQYLKQGLNQQAVLHAQQQRVVHGQYPPGPESQQAYGGYAQSQLGYEPQYPQQQQQAGQFYNAPQASYSRPKMPGGFPSSQTDLSQPQYGHGQGQGGAQQGSVQERARREQAAWQQQQQRGQGGYR